MWVQIDCGRDSFVVENQTQKKWCFIVAEHLSHYRFGVYSILDSNGDWRFTFIAGESTRSGTIEGIPPELLSDARILSSARFGRFLWQRGLLGMCLNNRPDVAVFVGDAQFLSTWLAALIFRLKNVPVLFWTIGWHRPENGLKRLARIQFYRLANKLLLYGSDGAAIGRDMGYPDHRMVVIGNSYESCLAKGTRDERRIPDSRGLRIPAGEFVGAVSRLTAEKRFDLLIEAARILRSGGRNLNVLLVGEGEECNRLQAQAADAGVPLILHSPLYDEESLSEVYSRLVVCVLPERAGLAVIQSLSHGTPVVSVDDPYRQVPEFRAIKNGVTGSLYASSSPEELARAIDSCADMVARAPKEVEVQCKLEVAENWSPEKHALNILCALSGREVG